MLNSDLIFGVAAGALAVAGVFLTKFAEGNLLGSCLCSLLIGL